MTMTFEKTYEVQKDNSVIIKLPKSFKSKTKVRVIVENIDETRREKIELLKKASEDKLFLADIKNVQSDFESSDNELL